ncbi:MAG: hypothetical protein PHI18_00145, partial [bacterium]|nr:hypothetical protein [bacterium]
MPEGNRTLSFTLEIDPASKQVIVKGVKEAGGAAVDALVQPFTKARKSFADIFSTGALLRITAAGYALQRIGKMADEPSAKLRAFKGDV